MSMTRTVHALLRAQKFRSTEAAKGLEQPSRVTEASELVCTLHRAGRSMLVLRTKERGVTQKDSDQEEQNG